MENVLSTFATKNLLLNWYSNEGSDQERNVNNHIHSPYSFSAFKDLSQAFELAVDEDIKVLGINDFFVADGYSEFYNTAIKNNIFPIFNIEFIGLLKEEQKNNIRVNDPNNPGRTYFCGKGLNYPFRLPAKYKIELDILKLESQKQIVEMIEKLNIHLKEVGVDMQFDYDEIKTRYAKELVRERHIAQALRIEVEQKISSENDKKETYKKIFSGKELKATLSDAASLEGEIRSNLLKAGGKAFVEEDENAFYEIPEIRDIILLAGGIPTYPVLLDNPKGECTEFEEDKEKLYKRLIELGVYSVELIPNRNDLNALTEFVEFFNQKGFVVTFGTEHNSPGLIPLTPVTRGNVPLSHELKIINYEGACVIAAHQYLKAKGEEGYLDIKGKAKIKEREDFILLGKAVIEKFLN